MTVGDLERDRVLLQDGHVRGRFHFYEARPPVAEFFAPEGDPGLVAETVLLELAGWNLTTADDELVAHLRDRGAAELRRYTLMSLELVDERAHQLPSGLAERGLRSRPLHPDSTLPGGLVELVRAAYPPGHPDEELGTDDEILRDIRQALAGSRLGPLMSASTLLLDGELPVGLALVNRVAGKPPAGGPWLTDLCRLPDSAYTGVGRILLEEVLAGLATSGERVVSLAVTEGNRARDLYESLGFSTVTELRKLRIPPDPSSD